MAKNSFSQNIKHAVKTTKKAIKKVAKKAGKAFKNIKYT